MYQGYTLWHENIDDVIKKWKFKISETWGCQIVAQMIAVIFGNNILDVLVNRLGFYSPSNLSDPPPKCPRLYLINRWP